ncbi:MAG TPA: hypothetical protein VEW67_04040 [Thermoleophilaceae bacterium]|nr:hypothetical protein [Thermoleophilaceae bacterium]
MTTESLRVEDLDATPKAELEKFVADNDIKVEGTGAGGNVLKPDLERAITRYLEEQPAAADSAPDDDPDAAVAAGGDAADDTPADEPAADPADEVDADEPEAEPSGEYVEVRRKIERTTIDGDWWDPFSDHSMHHSVDVCPVNGARRDGDEAVLLVPAEEADRYADR